MQKYEFKMNDVGDHTININIPVELTIEDVADNFTSYYMFEDRVEVLGLIVSMAPREIIRVVRDTIYDDGCVSASERIASNECEGIRDEVLTLLKTKFGLED